MQKTSIEELERILQQPEDIDLELKASTNQFDASRGSLCDYCAAIANGRGGKLILGVLEKPREVVGTNCYRGTYSKLSHQIWEKLHIHVDIEELFYNDKRVLIFHIPKHPPATRVKSGGKGDKYTYPVRRGESLGEMDDHRTREILNEAQLDFTATIVPNLTMDDLDERAILRLKELWAQKSERRDYLNFSTEKVLKNLGLLGDKGLTYAALIMVGKETALDKYLADAEIIFEWRHIKGQTHHDFRQNWRTPFILIDNEIWKTINHRNLRIPFQEGFIQREIMAYDEKSVREAIHNAVMHRDYTLKGQSVFILASPQEFDIESPGGFLPGITPENALFKKAYRNRLLAEVMEKTGLVERSSQGLDDIFEKSIRDGKGLPDLSQSEAYSVRLTIPAQVKDKEFILYLERIINERQINLSFEEIYELEKIRDHQKISKVLFKDKFLKQGFIEPIGKTRGTKYILSRRYYEIIGQSGKHTRIKGLDREQVKELILNHIREGKPAKREDLMSGFAELKPSDISNILQELKEAGKIVFEGAKKTGKWVVSK